MTTWPSPRWRRCADGRAGKVPVTGIDGIELAVEAIMKGEMAGTVAWDPFWQGGMGLSIGYAVKTGKFDSRRSQGPREFYGTGVIVTKADGRLQEQSGKVDWNDIWWRASGQIQYRG